MQDLSSSTRDRTLNLQWKQRVLTIELPGKSLNTFQNDNPQD